MAKPTPDFSHEATTQIRFPSGGQFAGFREECWDRYSEKMVRVSHAMVSEDGTVATVNHSRNLGAELKGLAASYFDGSTINTVYNT